MRVKRLYIIYALAYAHKLNGNIILVFNCKGYPALSCSVKLGQNYSRYIRRFFKLFSLLNSVLSCRCVKHQQNLLSAVGKLSVKYLINLFKLFHKIFLIMKSARRIAKQDINILTLAGIYRIVHNRRRV